MADETVVTPHTDECERALLGALIVAPECMADVAADLDRQHFYRTGNMVLYGAMLSMWQSGKPIDLLSLVDELKQTNKLQDAGGVQRIANLMETVVTTVAVRHHADRIKETAHARRIIATCREVVADLLSPGGDVDQAIGQLQAVSSETIAASGGSCPIGEIISRTFAEIDGVRDGEAPTSWIPTGIPGLDSLLCGFGRKDLIIIAARPSVGKSALALQSAIEMARLGHPCGFASVEMADDQVATRAMSYESRVENKAIRARRLSPRDVALLQHASALLYDLPIEIDDTSAASTMRMRSIARSCIRRWGRCDALFADYLQLMKPMTQERDSNREQVVAAISADLKATAKQLNLPVVALCQLSRRVEERVGAMAEPRLSDLRESGAIEQDSDVVLFLWTSEKDKTVDRLPVTLTVAKQRNGPPGRVKLVFDKPTQRFAAVEDRYERHDGAAAAAGDF